MKNLRSILPPLSFIIVSILSYIQASLVKTLRFGGALGGDFFPKVISLLTLVMSVVWFLGEIKNLKSLKEANDKDNSNSIEQPNGFRNSVLFLLIFVFAIWVMKYIGFLFSSLILVFFNYIILREDLKAKDLPLAVVYSVIVVVGIWYLFEKVFGVALPKGILW